MSFLFLLTDLEIQSEAEFLVGKNCDIHYIYVYIYTYTYMHIYIMPNCSIFEFVYNALLLPASDGNRLLTAPFLLFVKYSIS